MTSPIRNHVRRIDHALLALLDERARLLRGAATEGASSAGASLDDLLRRYDGVLPADAARRLFDVIEALCAGDDAHPPATASADGGRGR